MISINSSRWPWRFCSSWGETRTIGLTGWRQACRKASPKSCLNSSWIWDIWSVKLPGSWGKARMPSTNRHLHLPSLIILLENFLSGSIKTEWVQQCGCMLWFQATEKSKLKFWLDTSWWDIPIGERPFRTCEQNFPGLNAGSYLLNLFLVPQPNVIMTPAENIEFWVCCPVAGTNGSGSGGERFSCVLWISMNKDVFTCFTLSMYDGWRRIVDAGRWTLW